ncbi:Ig-like domain-containing protein [Streptomyces sp. NPDC006476]|uniref:L,D-transpeptidase n=1 Tax=Streptomyces sp. NPDC006476 TaxID=3157175 RepID=UPI0033B6BA8B
MPHAPSSTAGNAPRSRPGLPVAASAAAALLVVTACSGSGGSTGDGGRGNDAKHDGLTVSPASDSTSVAVNRKVTIRAGDGRITSVKVTAQGPGDLKGTFSGDKGTWTSNGQLAPGVTYTVRARATGSDGKQLTRNATFTTAEAPKSKTFVGEYHPDKGTTVGVAMPVSIVFNKPIHDRAAVERHLQVTSSPSVQGAWHWMTDRDGRDRVDFRPEKYWKPGTDVTLRMSLDGVRAGGLYGVQNRVVNFRIGDAVTTTVDTAAKTMTVSENGRKLRTLPVSAGKKGFETWNGTMVVLEKTPTIRMNSRTVSIFGPEAYNLGSVKWDVRLTPSGTFVHAAPWNEGKFGRINGSHGCIGMSTADAKWFYGHVHTGDPVTVVNSKDAVAANNGYGDWNVDWPTWQSGSALR